MFNLEGTKDVEIKEKDIERKSISVGESFNNYDDCVKTEEDVKDDTTYDYSDCIKTKFDIEEEKRKLEELRTMFEDCGLIDSNKSEKIR